MPTDDELDRRIAATARSTFEQVQRGVDPATEYEAFHRRLDGAELIEVAPAPVRSHRWWGMAAAAAVIVVAVGVTSFLVRRDGSTDVVAPPPPSSSPSTTDSSTSPATTAASTTHPVPAMADASPDVVAAGEQITITPAGFVQRACLDIVTATRRDDASPWVGQIVGGRVVTSDTGTEVTYPECFGAYSDDGFTFIVPATLPPGPYEMCLTDDANTSGCAAVEVTPATAEATACASEPFTPPTLADGTSPGEASIDADADGRSARWGAAEATNRVLQILDTAVDPEAIDAAVAAGRAFTAGTFQAAVLPVGDPPLGSISIFLRDIEGGCLRWYLVGPGLLDEDAARIARAWVDALTTAADGAGDDWNPRLPDALAPLDAADVPILLPEPLPSGGPLLRSGPDVAPDLSWLPLQVYGNDAGEWLHVETSSGTGSLPDSGSRIGPWAVTDNSFSSDAIVQLSTADVTVSLWSQSLTRSDLVTIAEQLRQNPDGTWNLGQLPRNLELVASGSTGGYTARRVVQIDPSRGTILALEVIADSATLLSTYGSAEARIVEVEGKRALYTESGVFGGTLGTLVWEIEPRIVVRFGVVDTSLDDLIDMAASIRPASQAEWEDLQDISGGDGCPAFWC
jgi:hypothetical protein